MHTSYMTHVEAFLTAILVVMSIGLHGQKEVVRLAIFDIDLSQIESREKSFLESIGYESNSENVLRTIPKQLISVYANDPYYRVIDKSAYKLVKEERERQKSIEFINGYMVDQGATEGADKLLLTRFDPLDNSIVTNVVNVSSQEVDCEIRTRMEKGGLGLKNVRKYTSLIVEKLNSECFGDVYHIVKVTKEKKDKAKELLLGAGSNQNINEGRVLGIYKTEKVNVNGNLLDRSVKIGEGEIKEVEDRNFSILKVLSGEEEVLKTLNESIPLYCKTVEY